MRIIVISDTHMPLKAKQFPAALLTGLHAADVIIHAGDWTTPEVYKMLISYAPVYGIAGNNDGPDIVAKFGYQKTVELSGKRFGLVHGHGQRGTTEGRALEAFHDEDVHMIIYGHSHIPVYKDIGGRMVFNPGSPTDKRRQELYSYGIIEIKGSAMTARHVFYKDKK